MEGEKREVIFAEDYCCQAKETSIILLLNFLDFHTGSKAADLSDQRSLKKYIKCLFL
jgi:hypothetical protein